MSLIGCLVFICDGTSFTQCVRKLGFKLCKSLTLQHFCGLEVFRQMSTDRLRYKVALLVYQSAEYGSFSCLDSFTHFDSTITDIVAFPVVKPSRHREQRPPVPGHRDHTLE